MSIDLQAILCFALCLLGPEAMYLQQTVEDIQNLLDSDELCLYGIPKVLTIQACQDYDEPQTRSVVNSITEF